jgi:hypothetical protein
LNADAAEKWAWESALGACYTQIGVPLPQHVVWAPSPLAGAFAAPIAACLATGHRNSRVLESVYRAIDETAGEPVGNAVRTAVHAASAGLVGDPVHGAAGAALSTDVVAALDSALASLAAETKRAVTKSESKNEWVADLLSLLADASDTAVRASVDAAVGSTRQDTVRGEVRRLWQTGVAGLRSSAWLALTGTLLQNAPLPDDKDDDELPRQTAAQQAAAKGTPAGWWVWPFHEFAVLCPRPIELYLEDVGEGRWATRRPHRADGPAAVWADGFGLCFWHGTHVPRAVVEDSLATDEILREPNAEIRRSAIERRGWDRFIAEAELEQVGPEVPDPGNPGQSLTLHDVPEAVYSSHVRVLLCTNGTVERDGTRRRFGLTVPAHCKDAIEAAAWTYGLTAQQYAKAQRRS